MNEQNNEQNSEQAAARPLCRVCGGDVSDTAAQHPGADVYHMACLEKEFNQLHKNGK